MRVFHRRRWRSICGVEIPISARSIAHILAEAAGPTKGRPPPPRHQKRPRTSRARLLRVRTLVGAGPVRTPRPALVSQTRYVTEQIDAADQEDVFATPIQTQERARGISRG